VSILSNFFQKSSESDSTSLQEQISSLEWIEATRDAALQLWRASLLSLCDALPSLPKQIVEPHRKSIKQLVDDMPTKPAPAVLEQQRARTVEVLKSYGAQMGVYLDSQDKEAKAVLNSVANLTETMSAVDQRYALKLQGITKKLRVLSTCTDLSEIRTKLDAEVTQLERTLEEQQRDTRAALARLTEDTSRSEQRRQRALPGPGAQHGSDSLQALERAVADWPHYCLVRYEFRKRPQDLKPIVSALPAKLPHPVRIVIAAPNVLLAAMRCQLLDYAGIAETVERTLSQLANIPCASRVAEPLRGETMREAMARLEKAG
jgi:hypothetical protein